MTKKKDGHVYPAAYVDLLETRVSVLVQTLTHLLDKSKDGPSELYNFCSDKELLNNGGEWDINKVISNLLPADRLQNLAESSQNYSLHDITDVDGSPTSPHAAGLSRSPSPRASYSTHTHSHSHGHGSLYHVSKSTPRRNSDNHVHKLSIPSRTSTTTSSSSSNNNNNNNSISANNTNITTPTATTNINNTGSSSSSSSIHSRLSLSATSPTTSSSIDGGASSLDIFKPPRRTNTLDSILSDVSGSGPGTLEQLDMESLNGLSDTNSGSTLMSPVYSIDGATGDAAAAVVPVNSLDSAFKDLFPVNINT
ncbi:hypothetical protein BON22_1613 [Cyberlindnera fabianii]|uniref:Uncharacterized protein n=1 Tax=Cyberlindnera fabianii TaxID=36022 RepID=A0A1V2LB99_CYBFA|nr:hypothetical protein BON22_1613 [Cyberlindnera fabianii]